MDIGTAFVAIAGIGAVFSLKLARVRAGADRWTGAGRLGRKLAERQGWSQGAGSALPSAREAELEQELAALKERLHVLERIATDANSPAQRQTRALADEIESLR